MLGIALADVSGKAMKAAFTAAITSGMLYSELDGNRSVRESRCADEHTDVPENGQASLHGLFPRVTRGECQETYFRECCNGGM